MKPRNFDWSSIPNIIVRGARRTCVARIEFNGREIWRTTKIQADPEGKNADLVRDWIRAFRVQLVKDEDKLLALTRTRTECCTFAELFAAYRATCAGRDIALSSVDRNILDMRLIVRAVHGEHFSVDAARVSLCTLDLLIDFRAKRISAFKLEAEEKKLDPEAYQKRLHSCRVTIKSSIQHARSLFAQEVMQERPYRELVLPDAAAWGKFMKFRAGGGTTRDFELPDASVIAAVRDGAALFKQTKVSLWFALVLTANFGMRRGSARNVRWTWFKERADAGAVVHVRVAKGGKSSVGVSPATWAEMKRLKLSDDFVLPGADEAARDAVLDELKVWLRGIGYDEARCPVHELRGLFVNKMKTDHSLDDAQGATGHASQATLLNSYVDRGTEKFVDVVA